MEESLKEIQRLRNIIHAKPIPQPLLEELTILIDRVERSSQYGNYSSEYESAAKYIGWVAAIPWGVKSEDNLDVKNVKEILDKNHYGMDLIKERILEHIAVMNLKKLKNEIPRTPIICFVGLQGIGKTSMAKSIAQAMGRNFQRIFLGGMPSALELLGRSKANPDAEPGLIIKSIIKSGTMNPVILLDEVEKCGNDPASHASVMASLLEILDLVQNISFVDNYIAYPVDLSNIFFVLTANNLGSISNALLDRLEVIKLSGYSDEEKEVIAKEYILPKMYGESGLDTTQLQFQEDIWSNIIRPLGYEAGIRELERVLLGIGRKVAKQILENQGKTILITKDNLHEYMNNL